METDRRDSEGVATLGAGADGAHAPREAGDGLSQSPAFTEHESLQKDGKFSLYPISFFSMWVYLLLFDFVQRAPM